MGLLALAVAAIRRRRACGAQAVAIPALCGRQLIAPRCDATQGTDEPSIVKFSQCVSIGKVQLALSWPAGPASTKSIPKRVQITAKVLSSFSAYSLDIHGPETRLRSDGAAVDGEDAHGLSMPAARA